MDINEEYAEVTSTSSGFVGASATRACHSETNLPEGFSLGSIPTVLADVYRARNLGKASLETSLPFGRAIISTGTVSEAFSICESILAIRACKFDVVTWETWIPLLAEQRIDILSFWKRVRVHGNS